MDGPAIIRNNDRLQHPAIEGLDLGAYDRDEFVLDQSLKNLAAGNQDPYPSLAQGKHPHDGPVAKDGFGLEKSGSRQK